MKGNRMKAIIKGEKEGGEIMRNKWANENMFQGVRSAKLETVIITQKTVGDGTERSPLRYLTQVWDVDGNLLASSEPLNENGAVDPAFRYQSP